MQTEEPFQQEENLTKLHNSSKTTCASCFTMIPKCFSDGISLQKEGPKLSTEYGSVCNFESGKSFRTAAHFVPKMVAKHFITTLTVEDDLTYYECIQFQRKTVMTNFSETVNRFAKERNDEYTSSILYEPDYTERRYIAGIELLPVQKLSVKAFSAIEASQTDTTKEFHDEKPIMNGDVDEDKLVNGEI